MRLFVRENELLISLMEDLKRYRWDNEEDSWWGKRRRGSVSSEFFV